MVVVRVRLDLLHFFDGELYVGNAAQVLRLTANIELADFCHRRCIGRQIMLDADGYVAARGKTVPQIKVLGEFDGVAVVEDRHRQRDHAGVRLHFLVAPHRDIHRDRTIIARRIVERQGLVADRPFARGEIRDRHQRGKRNENSNSTFHVRPRRTDPGGPDSKLLDRPTVVRRTLVPMHYQGIVAVRPHCGTAQIKVWFRSRVKAW
jgi:hypothetical protein